MSGPFDSMFSDAGMHKRISAAVSRMFRHMEATNPAAISRPPRGGVEFLGFDRQATSWGWDFCQSMDDSFHRADYIADGETFTLIADSEGIDRVIVYGTRDGMELLADLEGYVDRYAGAGADR